MGVGGLVPAPANKDLSLPGEFIIGRVFRCELCDIELADLGFVKNAGR